MKQKHNRTKQKRNKNEIKTKQKPNKNEINLLNHIQITLTHLPSPVRGDIRILLINLGESKVLPI